MLEPCLVMGPKVQHAIEAIVYTFPGPSYVSLRRNQATHPGDHLTCPSRKESTNNAQWDAAWSCW